MRIIQLDVLRAVAVILVVGSHFPHSDTETTTRLGYMMTLWMSNGGLGVDLFFVLSGYLVSGILFREFTSNNNINVRRFLIRRGFKIYPSFYVFLLSLIALKSYYGAAPTFQSIVAETLFVQNYVRGIWSHTWSLAVEEHFYLLLGAVFGCLVFFRRHEPFKAIPLIFTIVATFVLLARIVTMLATPGGFWFQVAPTHLRIDSLLFGVLLSYYQHYYPAVIAVLSRRKVLLGVSSLAVIFLLKLIGRESVEYTIGFTLIYLACGGLLISSLAMNYDIGWATQLFVLPLSYIGFYSYSIYLWHMHVLIWGGILARKMIGSNWHPLLGLVAYMTGCIVAGVLLSHIIEIPALRVRDYFFPSRKPPKASPSPA